MKFDKEKMRLYAITDRHWLNGRSLREVVKESLDGGVTFLQLRDKNSDDETFLQEAAELQELCRDYKVPLIINDNVEIALKMNAGQSFLYEGFQRTDRERTGNSEKGTGRMAGRQTWQEICQ